MLRRSERQRLRLVPGRQLQRRQLVLCRRVRYGVDRVGLTFPERDARAIGLLVSIAVVGARGFEPELRSRGNPNKCGRLVHNPATWLGFWVPGRSATSRRVPRCSCPLVPLVVPLRRPRGPQLPATSCHLRHQQPQPCGREVRASGGLAVPRRRRVHHRGDLRLRRPETSLKVRAKTARNATISFPGVALGLQPPTRDGQWNRASRSSFGRRRWFSNL